MTEDWLPGLVQLHQGEIFQRSTTLFSCRDSEASAIPTQSEP